MDFISSLKSIFVKGINDPQKHVNNFKLSDFFSYMQTKGWYSVSATAAMTLYDKNSALADCIDTISGEMKSIIPVISNGDEIIKEHKVLDFLKQPNPQQNWGDFIEAVAIYYLLTRNTFITAIGNTKYLPNEMWLTPTTAINAQGHGLDYFISARNGSSLSFLDGDYRYDKKTGRLIESEFKELLQISGFINYTTSNGYVADSILSSILYELEILNNGNNHNLSLLLNGVNLSGVFNLDTMDNDSVNQFKTDVAAYFQGSGNAGKYLVSKGKTVTFSPMQMTNKEMQQIENVDKSREVIYNRYQIPTPMRNNDAQTYDNYSTAQYVFYDRAVLPSLKDIYSGLTNFFRKRKLLEQNEFLTFDMSSITALQLRYNQELKLKNELNIYTKNELRSMQGADPVEGGDVLYQEMSLVPIGSMQFGATPVVEDEVKRFREVLKKNGFSDSDIENKVKELYADCNE